MADGHETDKNIEVWKIKKLIKALEAARGNGTSMISLIMPPRDQISRVTKMLGDEFGTASNIKSRVNRQSVLGAITSAQQRLKLYNKVPPNGLVLYTGTIVTEDGKEKKVTIDFEPFRPINASLYLCDNKFHTEALNELLESDDKFGFIVMDGNGTLFGTLSGNTREVLHKFSVDLPKKHGRGGQSALRFARLRMEKRHNYVRKTAELATQFYINPTTSQPNVSGLILAGSADFKTELSQSDMFDPRLQAKILNVVDVSYGGENGFNQAIELSAEILSNVKFIQEKRLIGKYFEEISQDTGKYVFGVDDTLKALEMGAVETLIVWENLDMNRYTLKNGASGEIVIKHYNKEQEANQSNFRDPESSADFEVQEKLSLLEWFANEYKRFGCTLEFVTNKSQEGSQFCRGFGGIGKGSKNTCTSVGGGCTRCSSSVSVRDALPVKCLFLIRVTFLFSYLAHSGATNFCKASGNTCSPALYYLPREKPEQKYVPQTNTARNQQSAFPLKFSGDIIFLRILISTRHDGEPRCFAVRSVLKDAQHIGHPECWSL
ncbi:peptide chain release factor subunit 1 [Vigna unguiculata]|uniref:Peptide chain release factor subunit 1 n=1 Tax=Vigna unguiculata TaxID=3917 RepID=A0A4D6LVG1_VIGUN|nr:peptide chain release factor subunit 1 [Vigna unguiculata]